jgi:hypothetical protein
VNGRELAMLHASLGRRVFPFRVERTPAGGRRKIPLVRWTAEASSDRDDIRRMWTSIHNRPGWMLPEGVVVVDIDDPALFDAAGLSVTPTASQSTLRGSGSHHLYSVTRDVPQVADRSRGFDTRVGGRGWVGLYSAESFAGEVAPAPDWLYDLADSRSVSPVTEEPVSSRTEILSIAGRMRWAGMSGDEIEQVLLGRLDDGRIYDADSADPWQPEDVARIAQDFGKKPVGVHYDGGITINFRGKDESKPPRATRRERSGFWS